MGGQESWESWGSRSPWDHGFASSHLPASCVCHIHPSRVTAPHHQQHPAPLHASLCLSDGKLLPSWAPLLPGSPPTTKQAEPPGKLKMVGSPPGKHELAKPSVVRAAEADPSRLCFVNKQGMSDALETTSSCTAITLWGRG